MTSTPGARCGGDRDHRRRRCVLSALKALKPDPGFAIASKLVKHALTADATKLGAAVQLGGFRSLPDSQISATTNAIKAVIVVVRQGDRRRAAVPLPSPARSTATGSAAYKAVDSAKLSARRRSSSRRLRRCRARTARRPREDVKSLEKLVLAGRSGRAPDAAKAPHRRRRQAGVESVPKHAGARAHRRRRRVPGLNGIVKKPKTKVELEERAGFTSALLNLEKEAKRAALEQLDFAPVEMRSGFA